MSTTEAEHRLVMRVKAVVGVLLPLAVFIAIAIAVRGNLVGSVGLVNPDEAELLADGRAAMRSIVPFTTWTTATIGPTWVIFLAILGWLGAPLTLAFGHLLAAVMVGVMGYLGYRLVAGAIPGVFAIPLTAFWWLPVTLSLPAPTGVVDFGALNTELLPAVLLLAAANVSPRLLSRPILGFLLSGFLAGVAVGAKYQFAPVAVALLLAQLAFAGPLLRRENLRRMIWWIVAAAAPFVVLGVAMFVTPGVSWVLVEQNINFLAAYGRITSFDDRIFRTNGLFGVAPHVLLLGVVALVFIARSERRWVVVRLVLIAAGLAAVYAGGMGFGHYLYVLYMIFPLLVAMPVRRWPDATREKVAGMALSAVAVLVLFSLVAFNQRKIDVPWTTTDALASSFAPRSPERVAAVTQACPEDSSVAIWGWAPDMYLNYGWQNAMPIMSVLQLTITGRNYDSGLQLMRDIISNPSTRCVVDAVGQPFFNFGPADSLTAHYPQVASILAANYVPTRPLNCSDCTVYVRK